TDRTSSSTLAPANASPPASPAFYATTTEHLPDGFPPGIITTGKAMRRAALAVLLVCMLLPPGTATAAGDRGWGYLLDKLIGDGLNPNQVPRAFQDPRMPPFTGLEFSPQQPREPMSWYRRFVRPSSVAKARSCRAQHAAAFLAAEQATRVPASVLAAILFIESGCG